MAYVGYVVVVRGRVQGVGFRDFTYRTANALGWRGEVWNRRDGAVEMVVHTEMNEESIKTAILRGPGRIDGVDVFPCATESAATEFRVGRTR